MNKEVDRRENDSHSSLKGLTADGGPRVTTYPSFTFIPAHILFVKGWGRKDKHETAISWSLTSSVSLLLPSLRALQRSLPLQELSLVNVTANSSTPSLSRQMADEKLLANSFISRPNVPSMDSTVQGHVKKQPLLSIFYRTLS